MYLISLSIPDKVLFNIIIERISEVVSEHLYKNQASCSQCCASLGMTFIDFEQVFDIVDQGRFMAKQEMLWCTLQLSYVTDVVESVVTS